MKTRTVATHLITFTLFFFSIFISVPSSRAGEQPMNTLPPEHSSSSRTDKPDPAAFTLSASLPDFGIDLENEQFILVDFAISPEWSLSHAGIPNPILQIKVPPSVSLSGRYLTEYRELAKNEFLVEPYERMIEPGETKIAFTLTSKPDPGDSIVLNVVTYAGASDDPQDAWLIRRRVEVPFTTGAVVRSAVQAEKSNWGVGPEYQIGDTVSIPDLPRADGSILSIKEWSHGKNLILTTYRAFW